MSRVTPDANWVADDSGVVVGQRLANGNVVSPFVDRSYTAAQLAALAAAGGLTPYATYVASDTGARYVASSASVLEFDTPVARWRPDASIILLGDSITNNNSTETYPTYNAPAEGFFVWANALVGNRFKLVRKVATGGHTLQNMIDRYAADVMPYRSKYLHILGGWNDLFVEVASSDTAISRLQTLILMAIDDGRIPIVSTTFSGSTGGWAASDARKILRLNDWLKTYAAGTRAVRVWDGFSATCDPANTLTGARSGYTYDSPGVHPNNLGAYFAGKKLAALLTSLEPPAPSFGGYEDYTNTGADGSNRLDNPTFQGTGGTASAGVTGSVPTGWTIARAAGTPTATCSIVAITDPDTGLTLCNGIELVITPGAANDAIKVTSTDAPSRYSTANTYHAELSMQVVGTPVNLKTHAFRFNVDPGSGCSSWWGANSNTAVTFTEAIASHRGQTPTMAPSGTPVTGQFEYRATFSAAGTPTTIRIWMPKVHLDS